MKLNSKTMSTVLLAIFVAIFGITSVLANERAVAGQVTLSSGNSAYLDLNDCTYNYYYGTARATTTPSSSAYFTWTMKQNYGLKQTVATDSIKNMSTTKYTSTKSYFYSTNGNYRFYYKINSGSYNGGIQATNSTTTSVL